MQVSLFGSARGFLSSGSAGDIAEPRSKSFKDGIETLDDFVFAADHLAVSALQAPDAAAGAYIHVMNAFGGKFVSAPDVVNVAGVAAINDDIVFLQARGEIVQRIIHYCGRHHEPDRARRF